VQRAAAATDVAAPFGWQAVVTYHVTAGLGSDVAHAVFLAAVAATTGGKAARLPPVWRTMADTVATAVPAAVEAACARLLARWPAAGGQYGPALAALLGQAADGSAPSPAAQAVVLALARLVAAASAFGEHGSATLTHLLGKALPAPGSPALEAVASWLGEWAWPTDVAAAWLRPLLHVSVHDADASALRGLAVAVVRTPSG